MRILTEAATLAAAAAASWATLWREEKNTYDTNVYRDYDLCIFPSSVKWIKTAHTRWQTKRFNHIRLFQHLLSLFQFCNLQTGKLVYVIIHAMNDTGNAYAKVISPMGAAQKRGARHINGKLCMFLQSTACSTDKLLFWLHKEKKINSHNGNVCAHSSRHYIWRRLPYKIRCTHIKKLLLSWALQREIASYKFAHLYIIFLFFFFAKWQKWYCVHSASIISMVTQSTFRLHSTSIVCNERQKTHSTHHTHKWSKNRMKICGFWPNTKWIYRFYWFSELFLWSCTIRSVEVTTTKKNGSKQKKRIRKKLFWLKSETNESKRIRWDEEKNLASNLVALCITK